MHTGTALHRHWPGSARVLADAGHVTARAHGRCPARRRGARRGDLVVALERAALRRTTVGADPVTPATMRAKVDQSAWWGGSAHREASK